MIHYLYVFNIKMGNINEIKDEHSLNILLIEVTFPVSKLFIFNDVNEEQPLKV